MYVYELIFIVHSLTVDYRPFKIDEVGGEDTATHLRKAHE